MHLYCLAARIKGRLVMPFLIMVSLLLLVFGPMMPVLALAQSRSFDEMAKVTSPHLAAAQKKLVDELKRFAASNGAREGTPEYWAIIQANLAKVRGKAIVGGDGERSLSGLSQEFAVPPPSERALMDVATRNSLEVYLNQIESGERIFGGAPAQPGEFREVVAIAARTTTGSGFQAFCTGTLIAEGAVLTAGHCVCGEEFQGDPQAVVAFGTDINVAVDVAFKSTKVLTLQPGYCELYNDKATKAEAKRDVALVLFDAKAPPLAGKVPDGGLKPGRIATWQFMFGKKLGELQFVGFGLTEEDKFKTGQKRFAVSPVVEPICGSKSSHGCLEGAEIVAIDTLKKRDTCNGDSGGPAFVTVRSQSFLAAITSRGGACGSGGVYSLLTPRVVQWLTTEHNLDLITCDSPARCVRRVD